MPIEINVTIFQGNVRVKTGSLPVGTGRASCRTGCVTTTSTVQTRPMRATVVSYRSPLACSFSAISPRQNMFILTTLSCIPSHVKSTFSNYTFQ